MTTIDSIEALEALYRGPSENSLRKVSARLLPSHRAWIARSRFCVISTAGPEGTDASPRGDDGPVVDILDDATLLLPDWNGNNRLDTLRNIVRDGRVSLMFMVAGCDVVMRVNGAAKVSVDPVLVARVARDGKAPRSVLVVEVAEAYPQCTRALMRADLWGGSGSPDNLPSLGDMLRDATRGDVDGAEFDANWAERAKRGLW